MDDAVLWQMNDESLEQTGGDPSQYNLGGLRLDIAANVNISNQEAKNARFHQSSSPARSTIRSSSEQSSVHESSSETANDNEAQDRVQRMKAAWKQASMELSDDDVDNDEDEEYVVAGLKRRSTTTRRHKGRDASTAVTKELVQGTGTCHVSKLAAKRAQIAIEHGADRVGANAELKGLTRPRPDGFVDWYDPIADEWKAAAPHDMFRAEFIQLDSVNAPYLFAPLHGLGANDITSNCSYLDQNTWAFDRESGWDGIRDEEGAKVMFMIERPTRLEEHTPDRLWIHNGLVMLNGDDRPVIPWQGIPRCFSSALEGARMEALRRVFDGLRISDFRARMPRVLETEKGPKRLEGPSCFTQRMLRFRDLNGCPPWNERMGTKDRKKRTLANLSEEALRANTTEGQVVAPIERENLVGSPVRKRRLRNTPQGSTLEDLMPTWIPIPQHILSSSANKSSPSASESYHTPQEAQYKWCSSVEGAPEYPIDPSMTSRSSIPASSTSVLQDSSNQQRLSRPTSRASDSDAMSINSEVSFTQATTLINIDLRTTAPQDLRQQLAIKTALTCTLADFRYWHQTEPPHLEATEDYISQYTQLQSTHATLWLTQDPPQLIGLTEPWFGSFDSVPVPHISEDVVERLVLQSAASTSVGDGWKW